jgi:hypothetical protein
MLMQCAMAENQTDCLILCHVRMPCMTAAMNLPLVLLTILGSVALAFVTGLVIPTEKVNGLWLAKELGAVVI